METRICSVCGNKKPFTLDFFMQGTNKLNGVKVPYWYTSCRSCYNEKAKIKNKKSRERNKENIRVGKQKYYQENIETIKPKRVEYRKTYKNRRNENTRQKRKEDPIFQLRDNVRTIIRLMITKNYGSKNGSSINNYLPYTMQELKDHLQSQFQSWMTWNNYGKYDSKVWNDSDSSTWTWQLDHIVPQSILPYSSMEDENFQKCWALSNLRPLSAKTNSVEGARRTRHKKETH
jgi:hypothetical protein